MMPLRMIGRAEERAELGSAWSRLLAAPAAGPRTAVVTGLAGTGKSLLVAAALDALDPRPRALLSGRARVHTPAPYDWLAAALSAHDTAGLPVDDGVLRWLTLQPDPPGQRYAPGAVLRQAVRAVRALVGDGPAVIVAEDLHALDPASLNLLGELAVAPSLPALLLVTSRPPDEADSPRLAARTLARLAGAPGAVRVHLGPLRPADVAALLEHAYGEQVAPDIAAAVCRRTGGNPYCLAELLAASRGADARALAHDPLPEDVRRLVAGTLVEQHPADGVRLATATPVLGEAAATTTGSGHEHEAGLTAREREVLSCLAAGMSNKQVASSLGISVRTVTVHVSNLLRKTRSASRTEAALWALRRQVGVG